MFRVVEHIADIAVEVEAPDRESFFCSALEAVVGLLTAEIEKPSEDCLLDSREVLTVEGFDDEELLIKLLNEFLFLCQTGKFFPELVEGIGNLSPRKLSATIQGRRFPGRSPFAREIKAATYHKLLIQREPQWFAKIVLDV